MYRVSPYTYLVGGLTGNGQCPALYNPEFQRHNAFVLALGGQQVNCSDIEFTLIDPPSGQTCSEYLGRHISDNGGYLSNPTATSQCQFCSYRTTDEYLGNNFNIEYSQRWRNAGIFIAFIAFNVRIGLVPQRHIRS